MIRLINEDEAKELVTLSDAITAIEAVMIDHDCGNARVFPVAIGQGSSDETGFAIKSGLIATRGVLGCKVGTYWPANRQHGIPAHSSTVLVLDDATGHPRAVVAASYLTSIRTAAVDAVAVKHLARKDVRVLGVVGAGHQALFDVLAVSLVRSFEEIRVWSRNPESAQTLVAALHAEGLSACYASLDEVAEADVILTVTPATAPILTRAQIRPGTHISAMGADSPIKQELDPLIARDAVCVTDVAEQAITIGELRSAYAQGLITRNEISALGAIARGAAAGRTSDADITLFDSSGIALQDLAMAELVLRRAEELGKGHSLPW